MSLRRWWCRHRSLTRIKVDRVWCWRCVCGYQVPIVIRTAEEHARATALLGRA